MEKKSGAGAAKRLAGSSALLEDKNVRSMKKLYFFYSSLYQELELEPEPLGEKIRAGAA